MICIGGDLGVCSTPEGWGALILLACWAGVCWAFAKYGAVGW